jgi:glycosyltransferase involved in cell wall biosynthesis
MAYTSALNSNRFRVLIVTEAALPYLCGVSSIVDEITKRLSQCELRLLGPDYAHSNSNGAKVVGLTTLSVPMYKDFKFVASFFPHVRRQIRKELEDFQPDVIMTLGGGFLAGVAAHIAKKMDIPVVGLNDTDFLSYASHYRISLLTKMVKHLIHWIHGANLVTLVSSPSYREKLQTIGFNNIRLWNFGIDTNRFSPKHYSETLRRKILSVYPDTRLICLTVSRLAVEKSIDKLLPIAQLEGVTLVIVGDGPDRERLEKHFAGSRSIFWGSLFGEELSQIYASADLFLTASSSETFGLTVLEALSSGVPSLVMDTTGVRDTVVHQQTGYICQSHEEMLSYACLLRDNPESRRQLGKNALARCESYSWDASIKQLKEILLEVAQAAEQEALVLGIA